jgi:hypothetical protein
MADSIVIVVLGSALIALAGFISFLIFCVFVVRRTNDTKGLRDVAVAVRAFASVARLSRYPCRTSSAPRVARFKSPRSTGREPGPPSDEAQGKLPP